MKKKNDYKILKQVTKNRTRTPKWNIKNSHKDDQNHDMHYNQWESKENSRAFIADVKNVD